MFQSLDVLYQFLVMRKKRRHRIELAPDQGLTNKHAAGFFNIHRPVVHPLLGIDQQAEQGAAFESCHLGRFLFPVRVKIMPLDQMRGDLFQPLRLDARHTACIDPGGLHNFCSDYPFRAFLGQHRIRRNIKFDLARPQIIRLALDTLAANIAKQAGQ